MNDERRKKGQNSIAGFITFLSLVIFTLERIGLTKHIGAEAGGYFQIAFLSVCVLCLLFFYPIQYAFATMIRMRLHKDLVRNVAKLLRVFLFSSLILGSVISALLYFLAPQISNLLFRSYYGSLGIQYIALLPLLISVCSVLNGYFQGVNLYEKTVFSQLIFVLSLILSDLLMVNSLGNYGERVSKFLRQNGYAATYKAAAAGFSLCMSACVYMLVLFGFYMMTKRDLQRRMRKDASKSKEKLGKLLRAMFFTALPKFLEFFLMIFPSFLYVLLLHGSTLEGQETQVVLSDGRFWGEFFVLLAFPILFGLLISTGLTKNIDTSNSNNVRSRIRNVLGAEVKLQMVVACFFVGLFVVLANPLLQLCFPGTDISESSMFLRISAVIVLFAALAFTYIRVLIGMKQYQEVLILLAVSCGISVVADCVFLYGLKLGYLGLLIAQILFFAVSSIQSIYLLTHQNVYRENLMKTFVDPLVIAFVCSAIGRVLIMIFENPLGEQFSYTIGLLIDLALFIVIMIKAQPLSQKDMSWIPGGKWLAKMFHWL